MAKADVEAIKKAKDGLDVWPDILRYAETGFPPSTPDDFRAHALVRHLSAAAQRRPLYDAGQDPQRRHVVGADARRGGGGARLGRQHRRHHHAPELPVPLAHHREHPEGHRPPARRRTDHDRAPAATSRATSAAARSRASIRTRCTIRARSCSDVTNYFLGNKDFSDLPRKYKISISGCPIHCNQPEINDLGIQAVRRVRQRQGRDRLPCARRRRPQHAAALRAAAGHVREAGAGAGRLHRASPRSSATTATASAATTPA